MKLEATKVKQFLSLLNKYPHSFNGYEKIIFKERLNDQQKTDFIALNIHVSDVGEHVIVLNSIDEHLFYDNKHYLKTVRYNDILLSQDIYVLYSDIGFINYKDNEVLNCNGQKVDHYLIQNFFYLFEIEKLIRNSKISFLNESPKNIIYIHSVDSPIFKLGYKSQESEVDTHFPYQIVYNKLKEIFEHSYMIEHFKDAVINQLFNIDVDARLIELIRNFETIIDYANKEYEVFTKKFSFKDLRKELIIERDKYFNTTRNLLDSLLKKVVGLPISLSASAFSIYKLKEEPNFALLVLFAYLVFTFFSLYLLCLTWIENVSIEERFRSDINQIYKHSGLRSEEVSPIEIEILNKIFSLFRTISIIFILVCSISIVFTIAGLNFLEIISFSPQPFYIIIISLIVLSIICYYISLFSKKDERQRLKKNTS